MKKVLSILLGLMVSLSVFANGFVYKGGVLIPVETKVAEKEKNPSLPEDLKNHFSLVSFVDNLDFVIGEDSQAFTAKRSLKPFAINRFETTYGLWYEIRKAGEKIGYKFNYVGQPGSHGKRGIMANDNNSTQPVSMISWYDAIVWCNAFSELMGLEPCYTYKGKVLRDSTDTAACDLCQCNWDADGYRLPSESEWEYAARRTSKGFQPGNLISGQMKESPTEGSFYAWAYDNAGASRVVGTAGIPFDPNNISEMGTGNGNAAGLFDMSGNVLEYCWDWYDDYKEQDPLGPAVGAERVSRGGSWSEYTPMLFAGDRYSFDPNVSFPYMGFRICQSIIKK